MKKLLLILTILTLSSCTWLDDEMKDWESNTTGLKREIKIYSVTGEKLAEYKGENVRVDFNEYGRFLANIDGKRVQAFNASVIIEEK
ncbi:hypothetical protein [Sebaldella termitidis]|uniref:hypothetical protein n=1 Tax=Sebaldella termitidis TaxID=826 RepID=UPI003EB7731D